MFCLFFPLFFKNRPSANAAAGIKTSEKSKRGAELIEFSICRVIKRSTTTQFAAKDYYATGSFFPPRIFAHAGRDWKTRQNKKKKQKNTRTHTERDYIYRRRRRRVSLASSGDCLTRRRPPGSERFCCLLVAGGRSKQQHDYRGRYDRDAIRENSRHRSRTRARVFRWFFFRRVFSSFVYRETSEQSDAFCPPPLFLTREKRSFVNISLCVTSRNRLRILRKK